jgi:hypothetical protein
VIPLRPFVRMRCRQATSNHALRACVQGSRQATKIATCTVLFLFALQSGGQNPLPTPQLSHAVFVFVQRTGAHVQYSKSAVFQSVVEDIFAHLKSKNVVIAEDKLGGRRYSEEEMSRLTVQRIARQSEADSMLYIIVDRPLMKWIRITAECYGSSNQVLGARRQQRRRRSYGCTWLTRNSRAAT